MKRNWKLLQLECKRAFISLPQIVLGTILFFSLLALILFGGMKLIQSESGFTPIKVALTGDTDGEYENIGISILENMDSTQSTCEFIRMEESEAYDALETEEVSAVLYLPSGFVQSIVDGTNTPAKLTFSGNTKGLGTTYIRMLTDAGALMLGCAQAGVYSAEDFYRANGGEEIRSKSVYNLNMRYISKILSRGNIYTSQQIDAMNGFSVFVYYIGAGIMLFFLLSGIAYSTFIKNTGNAFEQQLRFCGISSAYQVLVRLISLFAILMTNFLLILGIAYILLHGMHIQMDDLAFLSLSQIPLFILRSIPVLILICMILLFLLELTPNAVSGTLLLFLFTFVTGFISGCFLPTEFLPQTLRNLAAFLPTTTLHQYICHTVQGDWSPSLTAKLIIIFILLYGGIIGIRALRHQRT